MASVEGDVKLLGLWLSPFIARVRIALDAKGVGYKYVEQDLAAKIRRVLCSHRLHSHSSIIDQVITDHT